MSSSMPTRKKRTQFTPEQKTALEAAFDGGLTSAGGKNAEAIEELARKIDLSTEAVKVQYLCYY